MNCAISDCFSLTAMTRQRCAAKSIRMAAFRFDAGLPKPPDVIDQPRFTDRCGDQNPHRSGLCRGDRCQRLGVPDLEIIQREACAGDQRGAAGHRGPDVVARAQPPGAFLHGAVQHGRHAAFIPRQIDVARGHREAVALAHGARSHHLDAEIEVAGHSRHHTQLLVVLFAEDREIRPALRKQLADDRGDAAEEVWPEPIFQARGGRSFGQDPGGKAVRVHGFDVRIPDQVDILGGEPRNIGLPGARIRTEILGRRKLGGIDEDRDNNFFGAALRQPDQRHMAVMESSHGRHQRRRGLFYAKIIEGAAQCRDRADDHGTSRHRGSIFGRVADGFSTLRRERRSYQGRCLVAKPVAGTRFMIKAGDRRSLRVSAHFT